VLQQLNLLIHKGWEVAAHGMYYYVAICKCCNVVAYVNVATTPCKGLKPYL